MKTILLFSVALFINLIGFAQKKEIQDPFLNGFVKLTTSDFLLENSNWQSPSWKEAGKANQTNVNDWLLAYNDIFLSNINSNRHIDSLHLMYAKLMENTYKNDVDVRRIPVGVIAIKYNRIDTNMVNYHNPNFQQKNSDLRADRLLTKNIFLTCLIEDTSNTNETIRIYLDESFCILDSLNIELKIFQNKKYIGNLMFGDYIDIKLLEGNNNFEFINVKNNMVSKSSVFASSNYSEKYGDGDFSHVGITIAPTEHFDEGGVGAMIKTFYGCTNFSGEIKKPFYCVMGFNPGNIENFYTLVSKYNTNRFLSRLNEMNFDIIIVRFDDGADRIEHHARVLKRIIKTLNSRKFLNGSFVENSLVGYSHGALVARTALKMMEVEYSNNPIETNYHHSRLCISYDGEQVGANVPLSAQHSIRSIIESPQWYIPNTDLINLLDQNFMISSPQAKDYFIYHYSQTGTALNPSQGPHPFFTEIRSKLVSQYYMQPPLSGKPGQYPILRNIGTSHGSSEQYEFDLAPPLSTVLKIDKQRNFLGFQRRNYCEWKTVDGNQHFVFKRTFKRKRPWESTFTTFLDESFYVNNDSHKIDFAPGSTTELFNSLKSVTKFAFLDLHPDIDTSSWDCFLPVTSALDLLGGEDKYYYNLKGNNLLWAKPISALNPDQKQFGFPNIYHGSLQYSKTPFDAIYCSEFNQKHGAKVEDQLPDLTNFLISEAHYDSIWLQNLYIGAYSGSGYQGVRVTHKAIDRIDIGSNVTYKTQSKPVIMISGSILDFEAGNQIHITAGTTINAGVNAHFYINSNQSICAFVGKSNNETENNTENNSTVLKVEDSANSIFENKTMVFPNPSMDELKLDNQSKFISCSVYDSKGFLVKTYMLISGLNTIKHDLQNGMYILKMENNNGYIETVKFTVL